MHLVAQLMRSGQSANAEYGAKWSSAWSRTWRLSITADLRTYSSQSSSMHQICCLGDLCKGICVVWYVCPGQVDVVAASGKLI